MVVPVVDRHADDHGARCVESLLHHRRDIVGPVDQTIRPMAPNASAYLMWSIGPKSVPEAGSPAPMYGRLPSLWRLVATSSRSQAMRGCCRQPHMHANSRVLGELSLRLSDPANVAEIDAWQRAPAHDSLKRWMAGDRTVNNGFRSRG
jgi:hypothetical protein